MAAAQPRDLKPVGMSAARPRGPAAPAAATADQCHRASWTKGGAVLDLTGKASFHMGGGDWQCSGSVVNDS